MTPKEFVRKWSGIQLKEAASSQYHFYDVCALVEHPNPLTFDPDGEIFTFEKRTDEAGGRRGSADVWYRGKFIWEYKSPGKDLDKAYQQLLRYRESLDNPPLLITSDTNDIIIHTNFTGTVKEIHKITLEHILDGDGLDLLKRAFFNPDSFRPALTKNEVTEATAATFLKVADTLKQYDPSADPEKIAHFLIQLLFTVFAEDMGLLPNKLFTQLIKRHHEQPKSLSETLRLLFNTMREGGWFGFEWIPHFNGELFDDNPFPDLPSDLTNPLLNAADQNWANINPTIFGTLFERIIDDEKRDQLIIDENRERVGVHYTSVDDIKLIVDPVLLEPLREQWEKTRPAARRLIQEGDLTAAHTLISECAQTIASTTVLDPACGSGNFLYVALQELMRLQTALIAYAERHGLEPIPLTVSPHQLYGIEINPYAHELAQMTVWIGYIQWRFENGSPDIEEPILRPLNQIQRRDAILAYDDNGDPIEPVWPAADVIIGNPPFLGGQKFLRVLGEAYTTQLRDFYDDKVPANADLVAYWFERARTQIAQNHTQAAGLIATQSIRKGVSRAVLDRINASGQIFSAWSDNEWVLDGASVRVSIVCFDDGNRSVYTLDGEDVSKINPDLTSTTDVTRASQLTENLGLSFEGNKKSGAFEVSKTVADSLISANAQNQDVVKLWINGVDVTRRLRNMWIIDFGSMDYETASRYKEPMAFVVEHVKPTRTGKRERRQKQFWWQFARSRPHMRDALLPLSRFIATVRVAKHRLFVFLSNDVIPDSRLYVISRDDDYFFGVLHSKIHKVWSLATSSWHGDGDEGGRPTYNNTTCFETFPFPWPPGSEPSETESEHVRAIARSVRELVAFRQKWLHPEADQIDQISKTQLKKRTLTNLYNALTVYRNNRQIEIDKFTEATPTDLTLIDIQELDDIHQDLDRAVLSAYGWPYDLTDEQILGNLLALNLERAEKQGDSPVGT